jgi:microcystin-dependent protein
VPNFSAGHVVTNGEFNNVCPVGAVIQFTGTAAPTAWLLCDGASYLRTTYADLFAVIGTAYGSVDGTHFNVPDMRGRMPVGYAASGGHADVATLANNEGSTAANRRPKHAHTNGLTLPNHGHSVTDPTHFHNPAMDLTGAVSGSYVGDGNVAYSAGGGGDSFGVNGTAFKSHPASTGISVGNPSTNPAIDGTIGAVGTAIDAPAYLTLNFIVKT